MHTIAVISQKGGAGKTTLAVHLAVEAARTGKVTLVIDTDPQATASRWSQWRGGRDPEVIHCGAPSLLGAKIAKVEELGAGRHYRHPTTRRRHGPSGGAARRLDPRAVQSLPHKGPWLLFVRVAAVNNDVDPVEAVLKEFLVSFEL